MDFELQSLHLSQAATLEADALVLLWPDAAGPAKAEYVAKAAASGAAPPVPSDDPLTRWARAAVAQADIEPALGSVLLAHRLPGVQARKVAAGF